MTVVVIMPATATRLTTVAHVRGDLGLASGSPTDEQLLRFIDQASQRAASYCRRAFGRETVQERLDLCRDQLTEHGGVFLDRGPAFRIVSAAIDRASLPESFYINNGRELFLLQDGDPISLSGRSLSLVYEAGWLLPGESRGDPATTTAPDLPADVERAVIQLIGAAISASGRDMMTKSEQVEGVGQTDWYVQGASASLPHPEAEATLSTYRRLLFA